MTNANIELSFFSELDLNELHLFIGATVEHSYKGIYAREAIDFFLSYLGKKDILQESKDHPIIVLREEGKIVGTATLIAACQAIVCRTVLPGQGIRQIAHGKTGRYRRSK